MTNQIDSSNLLQISQDVQSFVNKLNEEQRKALLQELQKNKEATHENNKIDSHLSIQEKLKNGWVKESHSNGIVCLKKDLGNGSYVRELLGGVDEEHIGEQKFCREDIISICSLYYLPQGEFRVGTKAIFNDQEDDSPFN